MVDIAEVCQALQLEEEVVDIVRVYWQLKRKVRRSSVCIAFTFPLCPLLSVSCHCLCILSPLFSVMSPPVYLVPFLHDAPFLSCCLLSVSHHRLSVFCCLLSVSCYLLCITSPFCVTPPFFPVAFCLHHVIASLYCGNFF